MKLSRKFVLTTGMILCGLTMTAYATGVLAPTAAHAAGRHPKIHAALAELRAAREELNAAETDFGGHKADAIRAVDGAIEQLEICIKNTK